MKQYIIALGVMLTLGLGLSTHVQAANCSGVNCVTSGANKADTGPNSLTDQIRSITNVLLFVLGAVAVIMIIIGGFKYVTSNGDSNNIQSAKNTILYAIIGIIVAIMAYAIVNWVATRFQ